LQWRPEDCNYNNHKEQSLGTSTIVLTEQ
jgi:hypothetical protein